MTVAAFVGPLARADVQDGSNRGVTTQSGGAKSGDSVGGQVTGVVSSGRTSVDARNTSKDSSLQSGDASASNISSSITGLNDTPGETQVGGADVTGVSFADNIQDGNNRQSLGQASNAVTGDAVGGQVIGAVSSGGTMSIVAANTSDSVDATTGDSDATNEAAAFVGLNSSGGASVGTDDVSNIGFVINAQDGNNSLSASQNAGSSTGDGVAGQVIGAVGSGATSIDATNTSRNSSVETGDAGSSNDGSAFVGLDSSGDFDIGTSDISNVAQAVNVHDGNNRARMSESASSTTGDGVAGQVIGAVTSGSASIVAANTSENDDVTTGDATSSNDAAAFVGLISSGFTDVGVQDISNVGFAINVQDGNNRLSSAQSAAATTGDGVAGQVIGLVSAGASSIDATNASRDSTAETGDSDATNNLSAFVGLDASGDTQVGGSDISGVGFSENLQDGSNSATKSQNVTASSGDAVAGQVVGGVVSGGASIVVANNSSSIDLSTGNSAFDNTDNVFVGLASNPGSLTIGP
jgi:hypothetical protein